MGDYVTQERLIGTQYSVSKQNLDSPNDRFFLDLSTTSLAGRQKTYSYRSSAPDPVASEEVTNHGEMYQWLKASTPSSAVTDNGHPFYTTKTSISCSHVVSNMRGSINGRYYRIDGALIPRLPSFDSPVMPPLRLLSEPEVVDYGTRAVKATIPTRPGASLGTTMAELMLLLPSIPGKALFEKSIYRTDKKSDLNWMKDTSRAVGSEFLNIQFAIAPTIDDTVRAAVSLSNATAQLMQLQRDSGKVVRRKFKFPTEINSSHEVLEFSGVSGTEVGAERNYFNFEGVPKLLVTKRSVVETWFSGAYSYWFETDPSVLGKLADFEKKANFLVGSRFTPETAWELVPWSWLTDWYGTIGSSISNAERFQNDSLVMRYGYLMRKRTDTTTYTIQGATPKTGGGPDSPITLVLERVTKERVRASPYGFALRDADLSAKQWAILGALGMTKGPRARY